MSETTQIPDTKKAPFGINEENSVLALAFESPNNFRRGMPHFTLDTFRNEYNQLVFGHIQKLYKENGDLPTRGRVIDAIRREKLDDETIDAALDVVERKLDPREKKPAIDDLMRFIKSRAYKLGFSHEALQYWLSEDYESLNKIWNDAQHITDVGDFGSEFFNDIEGLFNDDNREKLTCGIPELDLFFSDGGPMRGELLMYMGATNSGKSIMLVNAGRLAVDRGLKVLHVTLENSQSNTALRYMGSFTNMNIRDRKAHKEEIIKKLQTIKNTTAGKLEIKQWAGGEVSANTIKQYIETLEQCKRWKPDVIIVDYLELMQSNNPYDNQDKDYIRQRKISEQLRALALSTNALVITATQANREGHNINARGNGGDGANGNAGVLGLGQSAGSYDKTMATDYIISITVTPEEKNNGITRLTIAKNREGQTNVTIRIKVNYTSMYVKYDSMVQ